MKNQNASAEYPHIPAKGSLQTALPMAALRSLRAAAGGPPRRGSRFLFRCCSNGKEATLRNGGWEEFFFSNCSVSSAGRRRGFPLHP